jgi:hypothetical protein
MASPEGFSLGINETKYFASGFRLSSFGSSETTITPGETALHEAEHAVVAEDNGTAALSATIVAGEGYLGLTQLSRSDPVAAAAPHANGRDGTGWDMHIVRSHGNEHGSLHAAKHILAGSKEKVFEVASVLQEKKTIGRSEIRSAMEGEYKRKREAVTVWLRDPKGNERKLTDLKVEKGRVMIPGEWVTIM